MLFLSNIDWPVTGKPSLHPWNIPHLSTANDSLNQLLNLVCKYFVEDFYICVHQEYWPVIFFIFCGVPFWLWEQSQEHMTPPSCPPPAPGEGYGTLLGGLSMSSLLPDSLVQWQTPAECGWEVRVAFFSPAVHYGAEVLPPSQQAENAGALVTAAPTVVGWVFHVQRGKAIVPTQNSYI